ncbi:MAG: aminotransferase class IV [Bacteroidales bacterium]
MSEIRGTLVWIDGRSEPVDEWKEQIGLVYKTPLLYEVVRTVRYVPLFLEDYYERLSNSFQLTGNRVPVTLAETGKIIRSVAKANRIPDGPVKLLLPLEGRHSVLAFCMVPHLPAPEDYDHGVQVAFLEAERDMPNAKRWNNKLRVQAERLLEQTGAYEALLVNHHGVVTEGSRSNIFLFRGDEIVTTPDELVLPGITRKKVLQLCREQEIEVKYDCIKRSQLVEWESMVVTGTSRRLVPVRDAGEIRFRTDQPLMRRLMNGFDLLVDRYLEEHQ